VVLHPQARTTPLVRAEIVQRVLDGEAVASVARAFRISRQTVYKWVGRVRASAGVQDRSSRPRRSPHATGAAVVAAIVELRRSRKLFAWQIALGLDVPRSTVVRILRRVGLHRLALLEPPPVFQRYEFERPGQLVHIDIKKLSKFETQGHRVDGVRQCQCRPGFRARLRVHRRRQPTRVSRTPRERRSVRGSRISPICRALVSRTRYPDRARHDRQRQGLSLAGLSRWAQAHRGAPPSNANVHTASQRQSRTIHSNDAQRVRLWPRFHELARTTGCLNRLEPLLQ